MLIWGCLLAVACSDDWPASDAMHITEPRPGASFSRGSNLEIRWKTRKGKVGKKVQIYLYRGSNFYKGIATSAENNGEFSWFIPPDVSEAASEALSPTCRRPRTLHWPPLAPHPSRLHQAAL